MRATHRAGLYRVILIVSVMCVFSHRVVGEETGRIGGWKISDLARMMEDRGSHLYWLELDLDGEKIDSDYFWNGKSDLYFKIEIQGNPNPIYSTSYSKNFKKGIIRAPFTCDLMEVGSKITVTVLDDDSGGKVLELMLYSSVEVRKTDSTTIKRAYASGVVIPSPYGTIARGSAGSVSHKSETEIETIIEYPQWLIQNEDSEVVADPIYLAVPKSGMSSARIEVTRNQKVVGTVSLHSYASTYTGLSTNIKIGLAAIPLGLGLLGVVWKRRK